MLSWRTARHASGLLAAAAVTLGMLMPLPAQAAGTEVSGAAPGQVARPAAPPVKVASTKVPSVAPTSGSSKVVAELGETSTDKFRMIGVTWSKEGSASGVKVEVRTRTDKLWSAWTELGIEDDDEGGDPGTEPLWIGKADGVAARVTSDVGSPTDVRISTIDPGNGDSPVTVSDASSAIDLASGSGQSGVAQATTASDGTPTYTPRPKIITRSQWGANAGTRCDSPTTGGTTKGVVVHHTAGSNSYPKSDSKAIVRGVQAYHMKARKWCDVGYNFLVDKYGQIFEGRRGGMDRAVRAAHSGNGSVNTYDMGVSMMGDFEKAKPGSALKDSMVKLIGWRMGTFYLKAKGTYKLGGLTLNMIAGHRNVVGTECPGRHAYAWLSAKDGLRDRVEDYLSKYSSTVKSEYKDLGSSKTGAIYIGESATSNGGRRLRTSKMDILSTTPTARARTVSGAIRTEYNRLGSRTGALGYPAGSSTSVAGVTRQRFAHGRVYAVSSSRAYSLVGSISSTYTRLGESGGKLGVPRSSVKTVKKGVTRADFSKGYVIATKSTGRTIAYSRDGKVLSAETAATPPSAVSGLTVKAATMTARLRWKAVSGATSYEVCLLADRDAKTCSHTATPTDPTVLMRDLQPTSQTDWFARVRAKNDGGAGAWSALKGFNLVVVAAGDSVTVPSSRKIALSGHGYGHGIGMSQYGAQGAAKQGVRYDRILSHYYPGTKLGTKSGDIRVLISQDTTDSVMVNARSGMLFRDVAARKTRKLPTTISGKTVTRWRILQVTSKKTQSALQYKTSGSYRSYKGLRWTGDGQLEGPSTISLIMPNGSAVKYRGAIRSALPARGSTKRDTVNVLPIEYYVHGVVAAEMPSSWHSEALKAQSVAARTYGVRSMSSSRYYDICSTTACQVYGGQSRETSATNAAIAATRGKIVTYGGVPAFTQFSSSSGGWTSAGSQPYLKAIADAYDNWSGNANHSWSATVSASTIEKAYPSIGRLKQLKVVKRTGAGAWGGRVTTISLVGSKKAVSITGNDARWAFGLKSNWFRFSA